MFIIVFIAYLKNVFLGGGIEKPKQSKDCQILMNERVCKSNLSCSTLQPLSSALTLYSLGQGQSLASPLSRVFPPLSLFWPSN